MSQRENFTIDLAGDLGRYSAECVVAVGMLTIKSAIGTRTIDAGASAGLPEEKARLEFKRVIQQHEAKKKPCPRAPRSRLEREGPAGGALPVHESAQREAIVRQRPPAIANSWAE
jgi:hypothetical protein